MEIFSAVTGVTKKNGLRVQKPISELVIEMSQTFASLTNEAFKVYIESKDGNNIQLIPNIKVKPMFLLSQLGEGGGIAKGGVLQLFVALSSGNAVHLTNDEELVIDVTDLKSAQTYSLDGFENPLHQRTALQYAISKILDGNNTYEMDVREIDGIVIDTLSQLTSLEITFNNGKTAKYNSRTLKRLASGANGGNDIVVGSDIIDGTLDTIDTIHGYDDYLALGLSNAKSIYIERSGAGVIEIITATEVAY